MRLYRLIQKCEPELTDFLSQGVLGRRCPDLKLEREWNEGYSVFDDLDHAIEKAHRIPALGRFVIALDIQSDSGIEFQQTFRDKHHYTIYAQGPRLLQFIVGSSVPVERRKK